MTRTGTLARLDADAFAAATLSQQLHVCEE